MARLPTAEALGERPTPQPSAGVVSYRPNTGSEGVEGEAMARAGKEIHAAGDQILRVAKFEEERLNTQRAEDAFSELRNKQLELERGERGFHNKRGGDAVKQPLMRDYAEQFDEAAKGIEGTLSNDRQRELFRKRANTASLQFREGLARHVAQETDAYSRQVLANTKATELAHIAANYDQPMVVAQSLVRVDFAINAEADRQGLPELKDQEKRAFLDQAWKARLDAWRLADPAGALSAFQANSEQISPTLRRQLGESLFQDAAPVLAAQLVAGEKLITSAKSDDEAQAIMRLSTAMQKPFAITVDPDAKPKTIFDALPSDQKLKVLGMAYTQAVQGNAVQQQKLKGLLRDAEAAAADGKQMTIPDDAFAVLGPDAAAAQESYRNSQQMARDVAMVSTMPAAERTRLVEQRLPAQGGPGYAEAAKRSEILARAVMETNRRQEADPAQFTIQSAPQTAGVTFQALQDALAGGNPEQRREAAQAFATATVAEQERLGSIPRRHGQRLRPDVQILPKPMADAIAKQFMTPAEGGQGPAQLIQAQADMWGQYWPNVYRQIAKDIGPTARVVSNLRDTPAAAMLSMNASVKTPDLKKPLVAADAKTVDETIDRELEPFRQSLVGWTTQGVQTFNDFDEAVRRNAYVYAAQGLKPADAAKRAAQEVVGDYYEFRGTVRIPKLPTLNPRAAETGMAAVLRNADKLGVAVPAGEARFFGSDFTEKQLAESVKANGFFVTLGDDSGVALYLRGANGERAVEGKDGKPITFTWSELQDAAAKAAVGTPGRVTETPGGAATSVQRGYGSRTDGTAKGAGYFGELKRPDGGVSTELSVEMDDVIGGKPFPLIVPTLTKSELDTVLSLKDGERAPKSIMDKAISHAEKRVKEGKSPFAGQGEQVRGPR